MVDPMSLFEKTETENLRRAQPLAARMRPQNLDEFVGQKHFLGEGKLLRRLLHADRLTSVIFYGPPGTGKTTLARLLATESRCRFQQLSAVTSGVKQLREILDDAREKLSAGDRKTLLFIDETQTYYVKGKTKEIAAVRVGGGPGHAYMDMAIAHVLSDAPGAGEEGAQITSGIMFKW